MFDSSAWAEKYDRAAQEFLGEERVLAAVQVGRTGGLATLALSAVSGAAMLFSMAKAKQRGGGLPQQWLLAVTERRVYALALPKMSSGMKPKAVKELARWERADVTVTSERVAMGVKLVIEAGAEGERVECQGPSGELSERVVRALDAGALAGVA